MYKIPILINIYRNKERVERLFSQLKKIQPEKLYIFQDGGINKSVIKDLDLNLEYAKSLVNWPCKIFLLRLDNDIGPAAAEYYAYKWMFKDEKNGIIIEDDLLPNDSFFKFAEKMLKKYEDNEKISYISGFNPYGIYETEFDYFFSTRGSLYCWATWKRFIDTINLEYKWLDQKKCNKRFIRECCDRYTFNKLYKKSKELKKKSIPDFEIIICATSLFNNQLSIVPSHNLVMNCGIDTSSINGVGSIILVPKKIQRLYFSKTYYIDSWENYPNKVTDDKKYRSFYNSTFFSRFLLKCEVLIRRFYYKIKKRRK